MFNSGLGPWFFTSLLCSLCAAWESTLSANRTGGSRELMAAWPMRGANWLSKDVASVSLGFNRLCWTTHLPNKYSRFIPCSEFCTDILKLDSKWLISWGPARNHFASWRPSYYIPRRKIVISMTKKHLSNKINIMLLLQHSIWKKWPGSPSSLALDPLSFAYSWIYGLAFGCGEWTYQQRFSSELLGLVSYKINPI